VDGTSSVVGRLFRAAVAPGSSDPGG
jgi:hypothetical protein